MLHPLLLVLATFAASSGQILPAEASLTDTRNVLDQWVETRQLISKEKSDWKIEATILQDTEALLGQQLFHTNQTLESLIRNQTTADRQRSQLAAKKQALFESSAVLADRISQLEALVKQHIKKLPEPLIQQIKPQTQRLAVDSTNTKIAIAERVQNLIRILNQTDKFNSTVTATNESREISPGRRVQVQTLYWGLAMAYYVDSSGLHAGIGYPSENGWQWPQIEGSGPAIQKLIAVHSSKQEIQFVEVPAQIR